LSAHPEGDDCGQVSPRWLAFIAVCVAYLATTTGEALLAPVFPIASTDLGINTAAAGVLFATLAIGIASANIVGGLMLRWLTADRVIAIALIMSALGAGLAGISNTFAAFVLSQLVLGAGAGLLYPAAIMSVGHFAGPNRRGLAMGLFGVFFSAGLTLAAALTMIGAQLDWRWSFAISGVLSLASLSGMIRLDDAPRSERDGPIFSGLRSVLGLPTAVGVTGGISQYATVSFLPVFAVTTWSLAESSAAAILAAGRIASVPAKLATGWLTDRIGTLGAARLTGVLLGISGLIWSLSPSLTPAIIAAVVFTATVSGLFPIANTLAVERAGRKGASLGIFRSAQIAAGALVGLIIGAVAAEVGLRPTIAVIGAVPLALLAVHERSVNP